jgi:N-acetylneuraminic acid mutarotase
VKSLFPLLIVSAILLSSCATQSNQPSQPPTYTISGTVTDLAAANSGGLVLQNNGADNLSVTANGSFHFVSAVAKGSAYSVTLLSQPSTPAQQCSVQNGAGTAMASVTNVKVECGHNEWAWMAGSQTFNQLSTYGTQGTPAAGNTPSGRQYAATWTDSSGDLWLFGGYGEDSNSTLLPMNDFWKFSGGEWTWIGGPTMGGQSGNYGTLGVPTPNGIPGARSEAVSWTDSSGNFWLFGGLGFDSVGHEATLNDLWKYSGGEWTWMGGSAVANANGNYGSLGVPAPGNIPGARIEAAAWVDSSGNVWLFGGNGYDGSSAVVGMLSDLWKYSAGQWTWMGGSNVTNQKGMYGTQGVAVASNVPGARFGAYNWIDASGNLWLFGGSAYDSNGASGSMNDLWKYSGGQWTWTGGFKLANQTGVYGIQGTPSASNLPGARQTGLSWTDASGNAWLFGGNGYYGPSSVGELNDLWKFSGGQWTWVSGSSLGNQSSSYVTEGSLAPGNTPAGRFFSTRWTDGNGNLWLFGGWTMTGGTYGNLNDLWMYMP